MSDPNDAIQIAKLQKDVYYLTRTLDDYIKRQDIVNQTQQDSLDKLTDLAARGRGSIWVLIAIGSVVTTFVSSIPFLKRLFT